MEILSQSQPLDWMYSKYDYTKIAGYTPQSPPFYLINARTTGTNFNDYFFLHAIFYFALFIIFIS